MLIRWSQSTHRSLSLKGLVKKVYRAFITDTSQIRSFSSVPPLRILLYMLVSLHTCTCIWDRSAFSVQRSALRIACLLLLLFLFQLFACACKSSSAQRCAPLFRGAAFASARHAQRNVLVVGGGRALSQPGCLRLLLMHSRAFRHSGIAPPG